MRTIGISLAALLVLGATLATAQTHDMSAMATPSVVSGHDNPGQIPDLVAYRLIAETYCNNSDLKPMRLNAIQLSDVDQALYVAETENFCRSSAALISAYNDAVETADANHATAPDQDAFWQKLYALAGTSLANIQAGVSVTGKPQIVAYLLRERDRMIVSKYDPGMPGSAALRRELNMFAGAPQSGGMTANYSTYSTMGYNAVNGLDFFSGVGGLGGSWMVDTGTFTKGSNQARVTSVGPGGIAWARYTPTGPLLASATELVVNVPPSNGVVGVIFRAQAAAWNAATYYEVAPYNNGSAIYLGLARCSAGSCANMVPLVQKPVVSGDAVIVTINSGGEISATWGGAVNGVDQLVAQWTDPSPLAAGYSGIIGTGGASMTQFEVNSASQLVIGGTVSGTTSCSGGVCPIGAFHTGKVISQFGSLGGSANSQQVLPQSYLQASYTPAFSTDQLFASNDYIDGDLEVSVACTIAGAFFYHQALFGGIFTPRLGLAITTTEDLGQPGTPAPQSDIDGKAWPNATRYQVIQMCTYPGGPNSQTPDMNVTNVVSLRGDRLPSSGPLAASWFSAGAVLYAMPGWIVVVSSVSADMVGDYMFHKSGLFSVTLSVPQGVDLGVQFVPYPCTKRSVGQTGNPLPIIKMTWQELLNRPL